MKSFVFPGNLEPEIRSLGAIDVPYPRTDGFGQLVRRSHHRLANLTGAREGRVLSFTASGTGAIEALLAGWGPKWRRLLVLHAGTFGRRWLEMARHLGLESDGVDWPHHHEPPWHVIEAALATGRYDAALAVHHETSTGELLDLARLGALCSTANVRLLVDAIGSFLADPFTMDAWNVDAAALSSQKGLCLPPGLSFLVTRPPLGPPADRSLSYYFDPARHFESFDRGQPPWSPAAQLYLQLDARLGALAKVESTLEQVAAKARAFRESATSRRWHPQARRPSACITALRFDAPAIPLVTALADDGWFVLPSPDPTLVRVAHLGTATIDDHFELADRIARHAARLSLTPAPNAP